jgi:proteasome lid subunit RPN8/RPN11
MDILLEHKMKNKKLKSIQETLQEVATFCEGYLSNEVCGLIGYDGEDYVFEEGKNIAPDTRSNFVLDPLQYLMFKNKYQTISIFHSHVIGNEEPSEFDILMSENSCVPFSIYALNTKKYYVHKPREIENDSNLVDKLEQEINEYNKKTDD